MGKAAIPIYCPVVSLLCLLLCASIARADIKLEVSPGFDSYVRPDTWTPLTLRLSGTTRAANGRLQVFVRTRETTRTYSQPIILPGGALSQQHTLYYIHPYSDGTTQVTAQILIDGRVAAEKDVAGALPLRDEQVAIVALTQDKGGYTQLNSLYLPETRRFLSSARRPYQRPVYSGSNPNQTRLTPRVLYPRSSALPDLQGGYAGVDAVVLGDMPLDALTERQWQALVGWVREGGLLIISGGADLNRLRSRLLVELLPVTPTGVRQVSALPALNRRYGAPVQTVSTAIIEGTLTPGAAALCRQESVPLVAAKRFGSGMIVFTAFDLAAPEFRVWPGQQDLWRDIVRLGIGDLSVRQIVRAARESVYGGYYWQSRGSNRTLMDALVGAQATQSPGFRFIGLFLLAYILCLVPLNYFLLKRLDRKEWAWITAPVIILLFSMGAYSIGYSLKGGRLYLRYCSVIEGMVGEDRFAAHTFATLFSPYQARYSLSIADPAARPEEVTGDSDRFQRVSGDLSIERDRKTTIRDAMVNTWDHRTFTFDSEVSLNGALEARIFQFGSGRWKVQVTNHTRHALTDCNISTLHRYVSAGNFAPGETRTVDAAPLSGPGIRVQDSASGSDSTVAQIKMALWQVIATNEGGAQGNPPVLFTGWFSDPATGLTVEDEKPVVEGANLLVVHLPPPEGLLLRMRQARPLAPLTPPPPMMSGATTRVQSAYSLNMQAYNLANAGQLDEALKTAHRALAFAPGDGAILDTVAEMYQRKKEYAKAVPYYERALRHQSGGGITETHAKYGETLLALGKKQEAIRHLARAARDTADPWGRKAQEKLKSLGIRSELRQGSM